MTGARAAPAPRARRAAPPAIVALAGAMAWAAAASAQEQGQQPSQQPGAEQPGAREVGPPLQLIPRPALPPADPSQPPDAPSGAKPALPDGAVRSVPLLPGSAAGPGTADMGPEAVDRLWAGLAPSAVAALVGQVPVGADSPAMRELAGRLLAAPMPAEARRPEVLAARAARLAELGLVEALETLAQRHGGFVEAPEAALQLARGRLTGGDIGRACAVVDRFAPDPTAAVAASPTDWRPLALLCALEAGRQEVAASLVEVLADAAEVPDRRDPRAPTLAALGQAALTNEAVALPADAWRVLGRSDPVLVALLAHTGQAQPNAILSSRAPSVLAAVARSPANAPDLRARAAERAAAGGVLDPAALAALWASLPFDGDPGTVLRRTAAEQGPEIRALLMAAGVRLAADGQPAEAARYRRRALYLARAESAPLPVVLAIVEALDPAFAADDQIAAAEVARALYAAGRPDRAALWRDAALATGGAEATRAVDRLWPLQVLADPAGAGATPAALEAWFEAETSSVGEVGTHSAATVLTLLQALGLPVDPALWHRLPVDDARDTTVMPSAALAGRLTVEAGPDHPAATALLSLVALGDQGTSDSHPMLLGAVVRALAAAGLDTEARRFAREAIWAAQI